MRMLLSLVWFVVVSGAFPDKAQSGVIVFDTIAPKGEKVILRAETRGRIFSRGGQLVEFFIDGKSLGKTLSGGDGVAFKPFLPLHEGLYQISGVSGEEEHEGLLLALRKGSGIVFIDVEGSLWEGFISRKPRHESRTAVETIYEKFPIAFLQTGFLGLQACKTWLEENEFPDGPVVPWREGAIFDEIVEDDLKIKAIIAAPKVIESAQAHKPLSFCFQQVDHAEWVKDWEEISDRLK